MSNRDAWAPGTSILFDVFALSQAVERLLADAMRDGPLTPGDYAVYSAIVELEAATPTQLASRLGMRLTTFVDRLRVVERRGHARRTGHPSDGRSYHVVLTPAGLKAHQAANRRFEGADAAFRAKLPDGEAAAKAGLRAVRQAADAAIGGLAVAGPAGGAPPTVSPRRCAGRGG